MGVAMATRVTADVPTTVDAYFDGKVLIEQPARGYRAGLDAVLLATANSIASGAAVLDVGAGVGTVGLLVSARAPDARVTLVERDMKFVDLARANVRRNRVEGRVTVVHADIFVPLTRLPDLAHRRETYDLVLMNPPFFEDGRGTPSPDQRKGAAHSMEPGALEDWMRFAVTMVRPGGQITLIHRTEAIGEALEALRARFGAIEIIAIHPKPDRPAHRVVIRAIKASRAPLRILPPLNVQGVNNAPSARVEHATRTGATWG